MCRGSLEHQGIKPVIPDDPKELNYKLPDEQLKLYLRTLDLISSDDKSDDAIVRFKSARYKPISYVKEGMVEELTAYLEKTTGVKYSLLVGRQQNVSSFMRKLLVQRLESSVFAFRESLNSMIESAENLLVWAEKVGEIPVSKKRKLPAVEDFYDITNDTIKEIYDSFKLYEQKNLFRIPLKFIREDFIDDVKSDINLLKKIRSEWFGKNDQFLIDSKLEEFSRLLREHRTKDPKRKIIVFSAFADTVNYLGRVLQENGNPLKVMKFTSEDATTANREKIRLNFDAGLPKELQKDDFDILIATDAISEGYNLNRAGEIFNYDIPYNPTRVIQRIGRINRINKNVFSHLYIFNFFPTEVGEAETRTREISTLKMAMIHAIMGEDTKVLTSDEEVQSFFVERFKKELGKTEIASWDTPYRKLLDQLKGTEVYNEAMSIPYRARIARCVETTTPGIIVFGKKGNDFVFKMARGEDIFMVTAEEAMKIFEASKEEEPQAVTTSFDAMYQNLKSKLFADEDRRGLEGRLKDALGIIKLMRTSSQVDRAYVEDLLAVAKADALSGYEISFLSRLRRSKILEVSKVIPHTYLLRKLQTIASVEAGEESLILTEQLLKA